MRILYITTIGATMGFFNSFIGELLDAGHTVDIACGDIEGVPDFYHGKSKIYRLSCSRSITDLGNIRAIREIRMIVRKNRYDIVHCHTPVAAACVRLACRPLREEIGLKVFYTAHGFHFFRGASKKNWLIFYPIERFLSRFTDVLITINKEDFLRAKKSMHAKKVDYLPSIGFDYNKFLHSPAEREVVRNEIGVKDVQIMLVSVGELDHRKNHQVIIRAISKLNSKVIYVIVGCGHLKNELKALAKDLGVENRVVLTGQRTDVERLLKAADIFVFPSKREGFGLAAVEAMASGLPLIASNINGIRDYAVDGVTGFQVDDPDDADAFAKCINRMIHEKKEKIKKYSENNKKIAKRYDYHRVNKILWRIYDQSMSRNSSEIIEKG